MKRYIIAATMAMAISAQAMAIGIFDNRVDKTSFLRAEPSEWDAGKVSDVTAAIRRATDTMYKNYAK